MLNYCSFAKVAKFRQIWSHWLGSMTINHIMCNGCLFLSNGENYFGQYYSCCESV